jgi:hypothetical protein
VHPTLIIKYFFVLVIYFLEFPLYIHNFFGTSRTNMDQLMRGLGQSGLGGMQVSYAVLFCVSFLLYFNIDLDILCGICGLFDTVIIDYGA